MNQISFPRSSPLFFFSSPLPRLFSRAHQRPSLHISALIENERINMNGKQWGVGGEGMGVVAGASSSSSASSEELISILKYAFPLYWALIVVSPPGYDPPAASRCWKEGKLVREVKKRGDAEMGATKTASGASYAAVGRWNKNHQGVWWRIGHHQSGLLKRTTEGAHPERWGFFWLLKERK